MKLFLPTLVGGIVLYVWSSISWMALPWHMATFKSFTNEKVAISALVEGATESGLYLLPHLGDGKNDDVECCKYKGPFGFIVWNPSACSCMTSKMIKSFLADILAALIAVWLLSISAIKGYSKRVFFITALGILIGIASYLQNMIWWSYPASYTLVSMFDQVIGFGLMGLAIGKIGERK